MSGETVLGRDSEGRIREYQLTTQDELPASIVNGLVAATPAIAEDNPPAVIASQRLEFVETAGAGTYTAEVTVPAGWGVRDFEMTSPAAWNAATAALSIGDEGSATRYVNGLALQNDPLTRIYNSGSGAYTDGAAMVNAAGGSFWPYYTSADTITAKVVTTGAGGATGRLTIIVNLVQLPATAITATKA